MAPRKNVTYSSHPNHAARSAHAKGEKMFRTYDTSYIRPKRSPLPAIIGIAVLVVAVIGIGFGLFTFVKGCTSHPLVAKGTEVQIVVAEGEGAKSVGKTLADKGLISNPNDFVDRLNQLGAENSLQPGTYTLTGGQSVDEIIAVLQTPIMPDTFTVPEGSTIAQTAQIVATATDNRITSDSFVQAASDASAYAGDYPFLASAGSNSLEGFLFPKTYPISEESTADSIIRSMLDQFGSEVASLDMSYAENLGYDLYDVVKLASVVEKESDAAHRAEVASVFYNRMLNGMRLESDATVAYVVGHDPTAQDVDTPNDYNTYFINGLPPTPINSPSLECLKAVCSPAKTDYLYFYFESDGSGGMKYTFSETYDEHRAAYE